MTIERMDHLLAQARARGYAIGYYEAWDQYSLEAVVEAAEATNSPAILGFGAAVTNQDWLDRGGIADMAGLARTLAERARVPAAVLFNEARTLSQIHQALDAGCNAVMLDTSQLPYEENVALTHQIVVMAHALDASVEAELGHLPDALDPGEPAILTDPEQAAEFVHATGVDALAVSIGNAHLVPAGEVIVDLGLLSGIHAAVPVPLVIHGGTGFPKSVVPVAIMRGVAKFNVGTRLKRIFLAGVAAGMPDLEQVANIHPYVGSRDPEDVLVHGKEKLKAEILRLINLYGSGGQAGEGPEHA